MGTRLIALYRKPEDVDAFMTHYRSVHLPLVAKTPHLEATSIARVTGSPMGEAPYFLIAEMRFPDRERFEEAMRSDENRAAGRDLMAFARDLVTLLVVEDE